MTAKPPCPPASSPPSIRTGDGKTNFVGDAQLPLTGKGASKFVTFALDSKTDIRRIDHGVKQTRLGKAVGRPADADGQIAAPLRL